VAALLGADHWAAEIHATADTGEIVRRLVEHRFDGVLLDGALALARNAFLLRELRQIGVDVPVIVILDGRDAHRRADLLDAGAAETMTRDDLDPTHLDFALAMTIRLHRTEKRALEAERRLTSEASHDGLTGLPNRALLLDRLDLSVSYAQREKAGLALLVIDLNGFTAFNTEFGRETGDRLLREVATRLRARLRTSDSLARLENDSFAVLLPTGGTFAGALNAASKLHEALKTPFNLGSRSHVTSASIGIAVFPNHAQDALTLLDRAERAAWEARGNRGGLIVWSNGEANIDSGPFALAGDLRHAIDHDELFLLFQPKVDIKTGAVRGLEALLRWRHPTLGLLGPDAFVPLAERTGWIEAITKRVLERTLERVAVWRQGGREVPVSVNVSAVSLHNESLPDQIQSLLERWDVPPRLLALELTESAIVEDAKLANSIARRLDGMGVRISIDDFGSGFTSFAYVRAMPVSEIKIDKSFVQSMSSSAEDKVIVRLIVELGHTLGLDIVAEGVEDAETLSMLSEIGCTLAQGFHVARPMTGDEFAAWIDLNGNGKESRSA